MAAPDRIVMAPVGKAVRNRHRIGETCTSQLVLTTCPERCGIVWAVVAANGFGRNASARCPGCAVSTPIGHRKRNS